MRSCCVLLLLLTTLTGCLYNDPAYREEMPDIPALEEIVVTYSDEMERYNRLFLSDSRAYYDHYVEKVCMKFRTEAIMDVLEARDLIVHVVEGFLARVNEDPWVSTDLYNFPFTADNLHVEIEFDSFYGKYVDTREIGQVHLKEGIVYYYANDAMDRDTVFFHKRQEPYEKAYRFSKYKHFRPYIKNPEPVQWVMHDASQAAGDQTKVIMPYEGRTPYDRGVTSNQPQRQELVGRPTGPPNLLTPYNRGAAYRTYNNNNSIPGNTIPPSTQIDAAANANTGFGAQPL